MALTSIQSQKTPGRPIELTFEAELGLPANVRSVLLIGRKDALSGSVSTYESVSIDNSADIKAASGEAATKFGQGSELQKMIVAAIRSNVARSNFPPLRAIALPSSAVDFGGSDEALTAAQNDPSQFIVSPFDGQDSALRDKLKDHVALVSGPQRVENNQFGSFGVVFNRSVTSPSTLDQVDSQYIIANYLRDTGTGENAPSYSIGEMAASCAAVMAGNGVPFDPLDSVTLSSVPAPAIESDHISVGASLESEAALNKGWTPLFVKTNGEVAFVRTVTSRLSPDGTGSPLVTAYYDVQDFQILYFWRQTLYTRFSQPDFKQRKASRQAAEQLQSELIRLARLFEGQRMFQAVNELAKQFAVERNLSDRHRFDFRTPVNVIPGLHVIAGNIAASTQFDELTL